MPRDDGCFRPTLAAGVLAEERLNSLSTARWDKPRDVGPDGKITDWNRQRQGIGSCCRCFLGTTHTVEKTQSTAGWDSHPPKIQCHTTMLPTR